MSDLVVGLIWLSILPAIVVGHWLGGVVYEVERWWWYRQYNRGHR